MLWFIIVAVAVVALLTAIEVRSWKKPSHLSPRLQAGYFSFGPGCSPNGNDLGPRGLPKPRS
jgi:hypothetical protein